MPLMFEVGKPAALACTRSVAIDVAIGSLMKVMSDQAVARSLVLSGFPVSAVSAVLASVWALAGELLMKALAAIWPFNRPLTTAGLASRKLVATTRTVVEKRPLGHWVFSFTSTCPWPSP